MPKWHNITFRVSLVRLKNAILLYTAVGVVDSQLFTMYALKYLDYHLSRIRNIFIAHCGSYKKMTRLATKYSTLLTYVSKHLPREQKKVYVYNHMGKYLS